MVAPVIVGAGISAVGSLLGGITGGKGANKAAKTQQNIANQEAARQQANLQYITGLNKPAMDRGNAAAELQANFLGLGNNPAAAQPALETFRGSTGYQDLITTGLGAVNANAYARGLGGSGATLKALQAKGQSLANQSGQQYLGNLNALSQQGQQAIGQIAGTSSNTTNNITQLQTGAADAKGNAALLAGAGWSNALQNIGNAGAWAAGQMGGAGTLGSSYGGTQGMQSGVSGYGGGMFDYNAFNKRYGFGGGY